MANKSGKIAALLNGNKRAQSALEYMLVYSWAIVVVIGVIAVIYIILASPSSITPSACAFTSGVSCLDMVLGSNTATSSVAMFLTNSQQYAVSYPQVQVNFSSVPMTQGTCYPNLVLPGGAIICTVNVPQTTLSLSSLVSGKMLLSSISCPSEDLTQCQNGQRQTYAGSFNVHVTPLTSFTSNTISITIANPSQAANGDRDAVTATVRLLGMPLAGATVGFTQSNTFATLQPTASVTDANGNAAVYISSTLTGTTLVTASFASNTASAPVTFISPANVSFQVTPGTCSSSNPSTVVLSVDSQNIACSQIPATFSFQPNSQHTYSFVSQVSGASGGRYAFSSASGCGVSGQSGSITAGASGSSCITNATYNAQYYLTEVPSPTPGGTVSPGSNWYDSGNVVAINAIANSGYIFLQWAGSGTGSYTGTSASSAVTMQSPITQQANFLASNALPYIYCVGTRDTSPYTQVYYAPISSTGVGTWISTTSYPLANWYEGCSISSNNYIYCVDSAVSPYTQVYYAPISSTGVGTWALTTNYMVQTHSGCSISGNYIYCVHALGGSETQAYYAPISSTGVGAWVKTTDYPLQTYHAGCSIFNGFIYCVGSNNAGPNTEVYYAPISSTGIGTWIATTSYRVGMNVAGCTIYNNYIYCVGTGYTANQNEVYYAPISSTGVGTWVSTTKYPIPMWLGGCSIYNDYIYCVGSEGSSGNGVNNVYYAPVSSTGIGAWIATTDYPVLMGSAYCEIPGSGGGYMGGGGPYSVVTTTSTTTSTSTSTTTTISAALPYLYCVGARDVSPYNYVYYAPISSTGVGTWTSTTSYPLQDWYEGCAISANNYIYCVDSAQSPYTQVYYAPISSTGVGTWALTTNYMVQTHSGCSISGSYIYCVGSIAGSGTEAYYAPISSTGIGAWVKTTHYPVPQYHFSCFIYGGNSIYCVGGMGTSPYNQVYYAPISSTGIGTWTATTTYPVTMSCAGCTISNNYVYCVGSQYSPHENEVYYAPISSTGIGTWVSAGTYPITPMYLAGCGILNGYIYCVGSASGSDSGGVTNVYYAPISSTGVGTWISTTSYRIPFSSAYCEIPGSGGGYLGGGGPS